MGETMELDDFKSAWRVLDQRLEREHAISAALYRDRRLDKARASLRPLLWGHGLQIAFGVAILLLCALLWSTKPHAASVITAGVLVQAYAIGCVMTAGMLFGAVQRIDYSKTVVEIQGRLAAVRRAYLWSVLVGGLSWWFLWVPLLMVFAGLAHVNLYANAPSVVWGGCGVGALGLFASWCLYAFAQRTPGSRLHRFMENTVIGNSLQKAHAQVEEVRRFEAEQEG